MWSRRGFMIIAIPLLAAAALALFFASRARRDPTYKGRTMGEWLFSHDTTESEKDEALISIGTNHLRLLVERIAYDPATDPVFRLADRLPAAIARRKVVNGFASYKIIKANSALMVFQRLGPLASQAVPQLGEMAKRGARLPAQRAITALGYIGEPGLPGMVSCMSNTNLTIRWLALVHLTPYTNSPLVRHAITNALLDSDPLIRNQASQILSGGE